MDVLPDRDPDISVQIWARERAVAIHSPLDDPKDVATALRKIADRIDEGMTTGINLN